MKRIFLPWPYEGLWPNDRPHWRVKAKATKAYRFAVKCLVGHSERGILRVTFCPKSRGPFPDLDNCIAAFKAGQDGVADAMGVNDSTLIVTYAFGDRCKDGGVIVDIMPLERTVPLMGAIS